MHVSFKNIAKGKGKTTSLFFDFVFGHLGGATDEFLSRWSGICFMIYDLQFNAAFLWKQGDSFYVEMSSGKSTFLYSIINLTCMRVFKFFDVLNMQTPLNCVRNLHVHTATSWSHAIISSNSSIFAGHHHLALV